MDNSTTNEKGVPFISSNKKIWLLETLKLLLGMGMLTRKVTKNECYIEHIAVSSDARGMGVGTLLLEYGERIAKSLPGGFNLSLYVAGDNSRAFQLYERQGFRSETEISSFVTAKIFGKKKWIYMVKGMRYEHMTERSGVL